MKTAFVAALALACLVSSAAAAEICIASQYGVGDGYHGRRTASGARFNTFARDPFADAHRTRPFGSRVAITNLANGRAIVAVVADRGPAIGAAIQAGVLQGDVWSVPGLRCVDLGRAGADAIGMGGTAKVSVQ
ncbi:rare lipoprotein A [Bradyrhizobium japonicum]|jgi:rare lipoprotein A|uniref:septal ring lytic transglycosylase RlpA family protein n=1 Tax=Bradyrhizobium TaxID=374 RepID=UPI0004AD70FD|nr:MULTISPECIES: septal ring lytic transglycosylase RlpA family protein [Bradyrhizobium]MBR0947724.1 septal ring lytic transglycosylase RlpA family protein [Bradyrhizobium liaoningense]MCS3929279.1 rare lipoprotein A [Bradyrhizobium elkanii]MCS3969835.1 rare lipoprotein A [Bradyrhizobium japonicum]